MCLRSVEVDGVKQVFVCIVYTYTCVCFLVWIDAFIAWHTIESFFFEMDSYSNWNRITFVHLILLWNFICYLFFLIILHFLFFFKYLNFKGELKGRTIEKRRTIEFIFENTWWDTHTTHNTHKMYSFALWHFYSHSQKYCLQHESAF